MQTIITNDVTNKTIKVNAMSEVLRESCISNITMSFLDDIPIKGCLEADKDETLNEDGCKSFVVDHIVDCEKVLQRLEDACLIFLGENFAFGQSEILMMGHFHGTGQTDGSHPQQSWMPSRK